MQWQHKGFSFKINQFIYSSGHTNVEQAQCLIFLSALCCIWLLLNTETTNHRNVKEFVTEISAGRISTVSDYIHAAWMFSCCVCVCVFFFFFQWLVSATSSQRWWWYSCTFPRKHIILLGLPGQLARQSHQAGCVHGGLALHTPSLDWFWSSLSALSRSETLLQWSWVARPSKSSSRSVMRDCSRQKKTWLSCVYRQNYRSQSLFLYHCCLLLVIQTKSKYNYTYISCYAVSDKLTLTSNLSRAHRRMFLSP